MAHRGGKHMTDITSRQRAFLRSMCNTMEPSLFIGKDGITDNTVRECENLLEARELIKCSVQKEAPLDCRAALEALCEATGAAPVQCIGRKFCIYRPKQKSDPVIVLPPSGKKSGGVPPVLFAMLLLLSSLLFFGPSAGLLPSAAGEEVRDETQETEVYWDVCSYISDNICIEISSQFYEHSDVYVCDIHIKGPDCFLRGFAGDRWNKTTEKIGNIAQRNGAVLAITGDSSAVFTAGLVVGNGKVLRRNSNSKRDICVMYRSGEMKTVIASENNMKTVYAELLNDPEVWQVFLFGPALLDSEGRARTSFHSNVFPANPRSVIGYYEKGHYCFVQVDGRGVPSALEPGKKSTGLTLAQLSAFMESLGCKAAYNLDGGQSSILWFNGGIISTPYKNGRRVGDIVYIADVPGSTVFAAE